MTTTDEPVAAMGPFDPDKRQREDAETPFEHDLDEEPPHQIPVAVGDASAVIIDGDEILVPIVPAGWRTWHNAKLSARRIARRWWHIARWHALRSPWHLAVLLGLAAVGLWRLAGRQIAWWWVTEQTALRQRAADDNEPLIWSKLTREVRAMRLWRGCVLGAEAFSLIVAYNLAQHVRWWKLALVGGVAVVALARIARPGREIIGSAIVTPRYRKLSADIVLRAYYAAKLGHPEKPDEQVRFLSQMTRDPLQTGSQVKVVLPYGSTFEDAVKAKAKIASGLDVSLFQVFLTADRESVRSHTLFVADRDPLAVPAGRTHLLDLRQRSIWEPFFLGLDERGHEVLLDLLWNSILVGAQPRKGKTYSARLIALYAALDPWVKLTIVDGKNSPDWREFVLVAHRIIFGTAPNRDGDPLEMAVEALEEIKKHIEQVNETLSRLPVELCPDGKLTPELARDSRFPQLRVWLLAMEEFQVYFETQSQEINKKIAGLLSFIIAVGPSAGVILLSSSQKPSGVGSGADVQRLFNRYRDNHAVRVALKCGSRDVSIAVLGGDAYQEGYDASALPTGREYRGIGYLYGAADDTPLVRFHLADREDAKRILVAARAHRERLDLLTGWAAGDGTSTRQVRDVLVDASAMFEAGEVRMSWPELALRLRDRLPEHYKDLTSDTISAQLRALHVVGKSVKDRTHFESGTGQGFDRKSLDHALARRASAGSGSAS